MTLFYLGQNRICIKVNRLYVLAGDIMGCRESQQAKSCSQAQAQERNKRAVLMPNSRFCIPLGGQMAGLAGWLRTRTDSEVFPLKVVVQRYLLAQVSADPPRKKIKKKVLIDSPNQGFAHLVQWKKIDRLPIAVRCSSPLTRSDSCATSLVLTSHRPS